MKPTFKHKRVAVDFDGTLFEDCGNINLTFEADKVLNVKPGASDATSWLRAQGFEILIFTCRPDYHRKYLELHLNNNKISYDYILFYTKPRVDLYIDDKGYRFNNWAETQKWVEGKLFDEGSLLQISQQPNNPYESILRKEKISRINLTAYKSILDVGCGDGDALLGIDLHEIHVDAVEPDEELREKAKSKEIYKKIYTNVNQCNISKYDCIFILGVLEHIENDFNFLMQFNGANELFITVPNANSFHRYIGLELGLIKNLEELGPQDFSVGHVRYYTYESLKRLIDEFINATTGYSVVKYGTSSLKISSSAEMSRFGDRALAINKAADEIGVTGDNREFGAEIYCLIRRADV